VQALARVNSPLLLNHTSASTARLFPHSRAWPLGASAIHNVPMVRTYSWARALPKLATKLIRIPAMVGGATIAGVTYFQYQAAQAGVYAMDVLRRGRDNVTETASSLYGGAKEVADQMEAGWSRTWVSAKEVSDSFEMPEWMAQIMRFGAVEGEGGKQGPGGQGPKKSKASGAAAGAATGAALGYSQSPEDDDRSTEEAAKDDQMMVLTKKMIEIRSILNQVGQTNALTLPSIVVIGSQSSGKSSVLEAIVGHEFLPKGNNMVTRRPVELTLVNTPNATAEYGEFPALGLGKITDFAHVQKVLTDLNTAVPVKDCVSDDPIQLSIYSPNVPDLSLIDLPGYIQVVSEDQPVELKQKIADLCDKYIQAPNIILAISAADVDLANSTALRASRRVDPRGERTIGVVTKMDLVEAQRGTGILSDNRYPLRLGYVGVVSRVPQTTSLFSRGGGNITTAVTRNENAFFSAHPLEYGPSSEVAVGTTTLRKKLMNVLEQTMSANLAGTTEAIRQELEEATYEFKVQYNDRPLSAESYLAESLDEFKHAFKAFADTFGRPQVRELLKAELDQRVLDILAQRYWNKPINDLSVARPDLDPLTDLPAADPENPYWMRKLDASTSALTKLGIGRVATTVVSDALQSHVEELIAHSTFARHPFARDAIQSAAASILNERFYSTSDQVENCIKPYKFEIEVDDNEWAHGRNAVVASLKQELRACESMQKQLEATAGGRRRLRDVTAFVDRVRSGDVVLEGDGGGGAGGFSAALLAQGRQSAFLQLRAGILQARLTALRRAPCAQPPSPSNRVRCPEIFLDAVSAKLAATAVLFLNVELLAEFYYQFPRALDARLGPGHLAPGEAERFAREDPRIAGHLDVVRRKELLELVLRKCESLRGIEEDEAPKKGRAKRRDGKGREGKKGWLF
jgi:dynamin-like GTPase MGM1, mitochondrial